MHLDDEGTLISQFPGGVIVEVRLSCTAKAPRFVSTRHVR
jgi:hypothetical protein